MSRCRAASLPNTTHLSRRQRLWEAITDPELRAQYTFGVGVHSDWTTGSHYEAVHP